MFHNLFTQLRNETLQAADHRLQITYKLAGLAVKVGLTSGRLEVSADRYTSCWIPPKARE
jgi:hypothetical protein